MYPSIELFYEKNKNVLFGELKPSKSVVKDVENCFEHFKCYWEQGNKTVTKGDVPMVLNKDVDENTRNQNIRVMQEFSFIASTQTVGVYKFTENFISLCTSSQPLGIVVLDALYNIRGIENLTMYLNYLLCCLREAYTFGEVVLFPDSADKFILKVPDKAKRDEYRQRVYDMYGFIGDTRRDPPHLTTDEYTPNMSYMSRTELEKLGLLVKKEKDGMDILVLTTNGHHLLQRINDNLSKIIVVQKNGNLSLQQIYYGAPGTGKSFEVRRKVNELTGLEDNEDNPYVFRTTFHPDYDYASFVGCYKPTMEGKDIVYSFNPQTFTNAYIKAWQEYKKEQGKNVCLVIEEINRGNCAQIFGDIFQLLDRKGGFSESPIDADKDLRDYLVDLTKDTDVDKKLPADAIKNGKLQLPPNLYILATMNTSDQSLFPMDSAFKRRWNWKYTPIVDAEKGFQIDIEGAKYNWWEFVKKINDLIYDKLESEDKKLGYFFAGNNPVIDIDCFVSKVLFYLWNDVFKDADLEGTPFKNHSFYSLFNEDGAINAEEVVNFLGDEPLSLDWVSKSKEVEVVKEGKGVRDLTKYSINGEGRYSKMSIPFTVIDLISQQTKCSYEELKSKWAGFDKEFIFTETEYQRRKQDSTYKSFEKVYNQLALVNDESVYILNNIWDKPRIEKFTEYLHNAYPDIDIKIEPLQQ